MENMVCLFGNKLESIQNLDRSLFFLSTKSNSIFLNDSEAE